ncbi:hypothetical protein [Candidatus Venteria ishoeyi]|uniref:hypothetical protein n=1 Tax=Candidatus Venteria ishoeyi TaxID=1899563 RepID=UPI0011AFDD75|nr:hypothetical protein [Candidatus Venteria ishoeyi]
MVELTNGQAIATTRSIIFAIFALYIKTIVPGGSKTFEYTLYLRNKNRKTCYSVEQTRIPEFGNQYENYLQL